MVFDCISPEEEEICKLPMPLAPDSNPASGLPHPIFNLAYVPKNKLFNELKDKRYDGDGLERMISDLLKLGYGEQLSELIYMCIANEGAGLLAELFLCRKLNFYYREDGVG